jgi:hypothetical protein
MTPTPNETTHDQVSVEEWLAIRTEAGLTIDPRAAEVMWTYANTIDPYGVHTDLPIRACVREAVNRPSMPSVCNAAVFVPS